tara:strand:+ start:178 stop:1191 length:1014 start_codon:yes stop_codon:yes gene_type:complete
MKAISSLRTLPHYPVMLEEVLKVCQPQKGGLFVDCTFGSGGYSNAILSHPKTKVIALDRDSNTFEYANNTKKKYKNRFVFHNSKFSDIDKVVNKNTKIDTIIFDLGLSSMQLSNLKRGFSFNSKGKPDMRMGLNSISGQEVLNNLDWETLKDILKFFGEEKEFSRIASNIVMQRKKRPITSIPDLVDIVKKSKKRDFKKKINTSTKTFQAIRMFVNKEIFELIEGLINAAKLLKEGGKIIVITFHSIEDKIVKFFFTNFSGNKSRGSRYYPDLKQEKILFENYKNKIIRPNRSETETNNSSRSAKLRFVTRSKHDFFYPIDLKNKFFHFLELEKRYV